MKVCSAENCKNEFSGKGTLCNVCRNSYCRYNLTGPQREELLRLQDGKCKICKKGIQFLGRSKMNSACVDHDHTTNKVRGIVCGVCNSWIGYVENNEIDIDALKDYLSS